MQILKHQISESWTSAVIETHIFWVNALLLWLVCLCLCHNARANTRVNVLERLETWAREEFCLRCGDNRRIGSPWHSRHGPFWALAKRLVGWFGSIAAVAATAALFGRRAGEKRKFTRWACKNLSWALWSSVCEEAKGNWKLLAYLFLWYAASAGWRIIIYIMNRRVLIQW
jgi:hypothetical protein